MARFRAQGYEPLGNTLYVYAAVQVWAQAVEAAGSLDLDAVTEVMHSRQFDTVLGRIGFDEKGDVTGFEPWHGTSGRRTAPTCRWSKASPRNSERNPIESVRFSALRRVEWERRIFSTGWRAESWSAGNCFSSVSFRLRRCARGRREAEILIGVAGPMTGANAWFGEQYQRGAELAVEDLNAKGGVLGQRSS